MTVTQLRAALGVFAGPCPVVIRLPDDTEVAVIGLFEATRTPIGQPADPDPSLPEVQSPQAPASSTVCLIAERPAPPVALPGASTSPLERGPIPPYRVHINAHTYTTTRRFLSGATLKNLAGVPVSHDLMLVLPDGGGESPVEDDDWIILDTPRTFVTRTRPRQSPSLMRYIIHAVMYVLGKDHDV